MKKQNIAIITGGNVAERDIALKSAKTIQKHLDDTNYNKWMIELNGTDFVDQATGTIVDKNDFSLTIDGQKIQFDLAFLMIHGHPAEDGCLQGYFDIIGLKYTGCDAFVSALTFNKQACKIFLRNYNIAMAPSQLLRKSEAIDWNSLHQMELPVFVKPNKNGSSYGVTKVTESHQLEAAVELSFKFDDEVIVEGFMEGQEFSNGVVRDGNEIVVLPITEIVSENDFFDYEAKYTGKSQEITPARLSPEKTAECQGISKRLYEILGCKGMTRFDYILVGETFMFLEANTIPGMSEASIFPQQALAHGWTIGEMLDKIVAEVQ